MTCCFIGHRKIHITMDLTDELRDVICRLIKNGVSDFIFGDHSEFYSLCYNVVTELREEYPQIRRIKFRKDYYEIDDYTKQFISKGYEDCICPKGVEGAGRASYVKRNQSMIRKSEFCIFYYNEEYQPKQRKIFKHTELTYQLKSGTKLAFNYAKQLNKEVINLFHSDQLM